MKKFIFTLLVLITGLSGIAQYKKASYFGKDGRVYGLGTRFYSLGGGRGTPMGYSFSVTRDQDGKQWFAGYDFQYIPSYTFEFGTTDYNGAKVITQGKTKGTLIYSITYGYFLLKNENSDQKIKPYVTAAISAKLLGGMKESSGESDDAVVVPDPQFSIGLGAGAGCYFYLKPWLGLKAEGGYTYQLGLSAETSDKEVYWLLPKHPYVSAGLVFRITGK
jgi:hypothetical protein